MCLNDPSSSSRYRNVMRLKICHIIPTLVQGGAEKQMSLLAANLDRERFEPHVLVLSHSGPLEEELRQRGVHVHLIGKRGKFDPTALWRLTRKLREIGPDVVHTWLFAANSYGRFAARRAGVPVIVAGERCVDPWKQWWHYAIDRQLVKVTNTIVTNTSAVTQFYAQHGVPASHFTVIPNAIMPEPSPRMTRTQLFERLGIEPRGKVVGAVGRLWKQKGYAELVWAGELLRVAYQDVCLVIIGDGPERAQLQRFRDQSGAQDSVRFVGHRRDAFELMSAFDVLWNGSLYEGQSNTILEAMSLGIPVVASDIPGNRDLVADGETGYLYRLGDSATLTRRTNLLLRDDSLRESLGQQAQQRALDEFSLEKMVDAHQRLYLRLCESNWH
jgi:glycosyltransferase involved in cell wall biosynthesis